jgi:YggT family protein
MIYQIISLILNVVSTLIASACLLRMYMQLQRVSLAPMAGNPFAPLIFSLSNWCVLPLRKLLPVVGRIDIASLLAAYLVILAKWGIFALILSSPVNPLGLVLTSLRELAHTAANGLFWLTMLYIIFSWIRTQSDLQYFLSRLIEPLLQPIRQILPPIGGIDFSPVALILSIQIVEIVLSYL